MYKIIDIVYHLCNSRDFSNFLKYRRSSPINPNLGEDGVIFHSKIDYLPLKISPSIYKGNCCDWFQAAFTCVAENKAYSHKSILPSSFCFFFFFFSCFLSFLFFTIVIFIFYFYIHVISYSN